MSILSLFKKESKGVSPISNTGFTDEDRERSAEVRKMRAEKKRILEEIEIEKAKADLELTRKELAEMLKDDDEVDDNETMEDRIMLSLLNMAQMRQQKQTTQAEQSPNVEQEQKLPSMTDEEIKNMIATVPKTYLKIAKSLPDEVLKFKIAEMMPVDDETIDRAVKIFRNL